VRDLRLFICARFCSSLGLTLFRSALAWQIYEQTGSELYLGAIGVVQFVPTLLLSLIAGDWSDRYDRRAIAIGAQSIALLSSIALAVTTALGIATPALILGVILTQAITSTFENPAASSLLPSLITRLQFPAAAALLSSVRNVAWVSGPVLAGFAIQEVGIAPTYAVHAGLLFLSILLLVPLRPQRIEAPAGSSRWAIMLEGIRFVRQRPAILGAMTLDMLAVIFGAAEALLPVFAKDVLGVGPGGYGLLSASFQAGTLLMAFLLVAAPPLRRMGRALLGSVALYALATVAFGLSSTYWLSLLCYGAAGMADQVSMVARSTLIQLETPDALRGRVNAVNFVFIGASNNLGAAEAGLLAAWTSAPFAVVTGGLIALAICAWTAHRNHALREYSLSS
jgi:MFS family permease